MRPGSGQPVPTFRRCSPAARILLAVCAVFVPPAEAFAQNNPPDRIVVRSKGGRGRIGIRCYIVNYNAKQVTFRTTLDGSLQSRPSELVVDVKTPQSQSHVDGLVAFTKRRFRQARTAFKKALAEERREWVRRELLAQIIRCALKLNDFDAACTHYLALVRSDADTRYAKLLPLVWGPRDLGDELTANARRWVNDDDHDVARLIGASILLGDKSRETTAGNALAMLTTASEQSIRDLARMQLWRKKLRAGNLHHRELGNWQTQIDQLDEDFRGGPYYLLGRARKQRRENEQAAAAFLWLPLVYNDDHHLAARACTEAADALAEIGRTPQAATLYREVTTRFVGTPFAKKAKTELAKIEKPDTAAAENGLNTKQK